MLEVQKWLEEVYPHFNNLDDTLNLLKHRYGIESKVYEDSVILNYNLMIANYPNDDIVKECRALQLDKNNFSVISRAFNRFLNYGEGDTRETFVFDASTTTYDKIDGSLVILYWHPRRKQWEVRTRKSAYGENTLDGCKTVNTFRELILLALGEDNLSFLDNSDLNTSNSYVFELVSPENKIVTNYKYRALYYLSTFNNLTGEEPDYDTGYDYIKSYLPSCREVQRYSWGDINTVLEIVKSIAPTEEGYVVRNSQNQRVKVKNPVYVALSHLHNNGQMTNRRILELIEIGEDSEYLAYFPEERERFEQIKSTKQKLIQDSLSKYSELQNIKEQKDFAKEALKYPYSGILFKLRSGAEITEIWNKLSLGSKIKLLNLE